MEATAENLITLARLFRFVREAQSEGQNRGQRVEAIQHWSGGHSGDSWCCEFVTMLLDLLFQGASPIPRDVACQDVYDVGKKNGWIVTDPRAGDLYLYVNDADHAHHIGIVTGIAPLTGIAGNTSSDGTSSNGDGVYEHAINAHVFVRVPLSSAS